eukprot:CAMPEP_0198353232 /NCGR_PEP_ID=MMETSP1450-20131203/110717_1 /TAXON_ID=753684 ORGANISM="Madagascaria erythrocladiodes, Strain CCMP3234" /NCGR_SAMPLE_ID=MMETSP1450 /ASSEMBLY_ACC=CAM_ASM_001115 /LENGTH=53 /DNA_ID=CAMNT_0044059353 /DNA_START=41 /DNA_END=198 /DNA_ORIENTATION=-
MSSLTASQLSEAGFRCFATYFRHINLKDEKIVTTSPTSVLRNDKHDAESLGNG